MNDLMAASSPDLCHRCGEPRASGDLCPFCTARLALRTKEDELTPGRCGAPTVRLGNYELEAEIGRGAMGVVYRARQIGVERVVALKLILAGEFASQSDRQRFRAEAEAAARLDHPGIVPLYEIGEAAGRQFYTMKLLPGRSLGALLAERRDEGGFLAPKDAARIIRCVARAIQHAHERGVLHRDLKPANILLDEHGEPRVTDFGLARRLDCDVGITLGGSLLGTPAYMAPEQALGTSVPTIAADIYGLGAMLYELLAARPPFVANSMGTLLRKISEEEPPPLTGHLPIGPIKFVVPPDLAIICLQCLRKDPATRYSTAGALADDLERWLCGQPIAARPSGAVERVWLWGRRKPVLAALSLVATMFLVLGVAGITWQWRRAETASIAREHELERTLLQQARAERNSGQSGHRGRAIEAIRTAAARHPTLDLRNEAVAAFLLVDAVATRQVPNAALLFGPELARELPPANEPARRVSIDAHIDWPPPTERVAAELRVHPAADMAVGWNRQSFWVENLITRERAWEHNSVEDLSGARDLTVSADGLWVALVEAARLRIFGAPQSDALATFPLAAGYLSPLFSPGGDQIAVADGSDVRVVTWANPAVSQQHSFNSAIRSWAWHPGGSALAIGCENGSVLWWDLPTGRTRTIGQHDREVQRLLFSHRGDLLVTSSFGGGCRFWQPDQGRLLLSATLGEPLRFSPDDRWLGLRRPRGGWQVCAVTQPDGFWSVRCEGKTDLNQNVGGADLSRNGRQLAAVSFHGLWLWDLDRHREVARREISDNHSVLFEPDDRTLLVSGSGGLHRWRIESQASRSLLVDATTLPGRFTRMKRTALGYLLNESRRPTRLLNSALATLTELAPTGYLATMDLSPNGRWFVGDPWPGPGTQLWETSTNTAPRLLSTNHASVAFSPDGRWLVTGELDRFLTWDTASWVVRHTVARQPGEFPQAPCAFSPDGRLLALAHGDGRIDLVRPTSGELVVSWTAPTSADLSLLAFSADGQRLIATHDNLVHVWDLAAIRDFLRSFKLDWPDVQEHQREGSDP